MNNNKLIAEFMRLPLVPCSIGTEHGVVTEGYKHPKVDVPVIPSGMQYHTSWDWLMPVVQKIESLGYVFTIQGGKAEYGEMISEPQCFIAEDKLSSTYKAVVEFIKAHKKYPFNEGDDYWVVEDGEILWGVWDDASEDMHDENPNRKYFTEEEAIDYARAYGIKYNKQ